MAHALQAMECDGCGQTDPDPKLHYGMQTYHHDCIPHFVYRDLTEPGYIDADTGAWTPDPDAELSDDVVAQVERTKAIIKAAKDGTRGEKLRVKIQKLHEEK